MSAWITPVTLRGAQASLEPLQTVHTEALADAVRDGRLWELWFTSVPAPDGMAQEVRRRLELQAQGRMLPFVARDRSGQVVGMTSFMNIEPAHRRLEIGSTFYARSVQRTALNTQCKQLLLTHAFETLNCIAVEFRTHRLNTASRRAIERLGAQLDGVLRHHQVLADGSLRDTAVYSITAPEWPVVRRHLRSLLERER